MAEALFTRDGDVYHPTRLTEGPWSPDAQHGGPPAALLAGAIERARSEVEMLGARVTVELPRPVPLQPLRLRIQLVRPGRRVQLVEATLTHEDQEIVRALGLRVRRAQVELPFDPSEKDGAAGPETGRPPDFFERPGAFATEPWRSA